MWLMAVLLLSASAGSSSQRPRSHSVDSPAGRPVSGSVDSPAGRPFSAPVSGSVDSPAGRPHQLDQNKISKPKKGLFINSVPQIPDEIQITQIVNDLKNRYQPYLRPDKRVLPMFSLAVSIPYDNNNKYDVSEVTDDPKKVKKAILGCDVYISERMVAATVLKWDDVLKQCPDALVPWQDVLDKCQRNSMTWTEMKECRDAVTGRADHAEYRVLQNFNTLTKNLNKQDFLVFYVFASPCDQRCASENHSSNILDSINVIKQWANYAVVFSKVFVPRGGKPIPAEKLKGALERLGAQIGLQNIYRCDGSVSCTRCSRDNNVDPDCYSDGPSPNRKVSSTSFILPHQQHSARFY